MQIGVVSGKGGVGKTTIAVSLARALSERYRVGLVDLDISSHNVDDELGGEVSAVGDHLIPAKKGNLEYVFYQSSDKQITWKGKDYADVAEQLIKRTRWNNPEYLVIDFPPGTDEVTQKLLPECDCVIIVLQPHRYSLSNAVRVIELCRDTETPIAGAIINFAYLQCECGRVHEIFRDREEVKEKLDKFGIPVIQEIPVVNGGLSIQIDLDRVMECIGNPVTIKREKSVVRELLKKAVRSGLI